MKWRCYSCGLQLGDGMPPIEALSASQAEVVGVDFVNNVLSGTRFEGMSAYSFCGTCLTLIRVCPQVFDEDPPINHEYEWTFEGLSCACGASCDFSIMHGRQNWVGNRWLRYHRAEVLDVDMSQLLPIYGEI